MKPKWAEENLQTIRTLMERSAVYRRALAPIMLFAGALGVIGGDRWTFISSGFDACFCCALAWHGDRWRSPEHF